MYLPHRVLEVNSSAGLPILKLTQTMGITGQYSAYSHCQGGHGDFRTYKFSLQDYMNAIDPSSISKTVFDAVAITRGLGPRYLWVTHCVASKTILKTGTLNLLPWIWYTEMQLSQSRPTVRTTGEEGVFCNYQSVLKLFESHSLLNPPHSCTVQIIFYFFLFFTYHHDCVSFSFPQITDTFYTSCKYAK